MIIKYLSTTISAKLKANTNEPTEKSALVKFLRLSFPGVYERKNTAWVEIYQKSAFQKCPFYIYLFGCGIINDFTFYKARGVNYVIFPLDGTHLGAVRGLIHQKAPTRVRQQELN